MTCDNCGNPLADDEPFFVLDTRRATSSETRVDSATLCAVCHGFVEHALLIAIGPHAGNPNRMFIGRQTTPGAHDPDTLPDIGRTLDRMAALIMAEQRADRREARLMRLVASFMGKPTVDGLGNMRPVDADQALKFALEAERTVTDYLDDADDVDGETPRLS